MQTLAVDSSHGSKLSLTVFASFTHEMLLATSLKLHQKASWWTRWVLRRNSTLSVHLWWSCNPPRNPSKDIITACFNHLFQKLHGYTRSWSWSFRAMPAILLLKVFAIGTEATSTTIPLSCLASADGSIPHSIWLWACKVDRLLVLPNWNDTISFPKKLLSLVKVLHSFCWRA